MTQLKLKHGTSVVVADGEKAIFLKNEGDATYPNLKLVHEMKMENPPSREQGTDRPGRFNDGPSVHRSAVEETDWHRQNKERFAAEVLEELKSDDYERVVLVAGPLVLGEMRKSFPTEVSSKVVAEITKTLTNHSVPEIEKLLMKE
ncbi:host attachment family protein [Corticibacterium sp. UT-5YL-CI-8]|nr:host attachment family protein [Tianweitania sp. UT-5YL-CI-8]